MSPAAHLRAVPDPEPEPDEAPAPGDRPVLVPTLADLFPAEPPGHKPGESDDNDVQDHDPDDEEPGEEDDEDEGLDEEAGEFEDAAAGRCMTLPNLLPYVDPRPLAALGPLAVEAGRTLGPLAVQAGKTAGPPLFRALGQGIRKAGRMIAWYCRGIGVILVLITGWLCGRFGKGGLGVRFIGAAFCVFCVAKLCQQFPAAPYVTIAITILIFAMAAGGHIQVPDSNPAKKGEEKGKGVKEKDAKVPAQGKAAAADKTPTTPAQPAPEVSKDPTPDTPRWAARLFRRQASSTDTPTGTPVGAPANLPAAAPADPPEDTPEQLPEPVEEEAPEAPREDPLTALIRKAIGGENGVHLAVLRPLMREGLPALSQATDKELREHLLAAGFDPTRTFRARGVAGRSGVHRTDPALTPSPGAAQEDSPDHSPPTLHPSPPAKISALSTPLPAPRRADEESGTWTPEEIQRGFRCVPDPTRGPSASKIEQWTGP
ncbi:hypothetical protein [Streptomyces sp. H27-H5]|uniref:hypothetical protein n=1 Tax=Streptomyces sp. H27-H5 TaxID=2996460 RepID=UPI0022713D2B|nr:hypothetical protein [Streptomyces sp. H27-H5]MCY0957696.1 hypothetical protein [Streptomyces sp. H27-H5]